MNPTLTVIITCYNNENYIKECVDSVEKQSFPNIEIILIDDSSNDNSLYLCEELAKENNKIKQISHKENHGVEYSRNEGLFNAKGEWILFLDGDDSLTIGAAEALVGAVRATTDIVVSNFVEYNCYYSREEKASLKQKEYDIREFVNHIGEDISWGTLSCIGNKIYKKSFLDRNKIQFEKKYKFNEDGGFIVNALMVANKIAFINNITYRYRKNNSSSMTSYRENSFWTVNRVNGDLKKLFDINNCSDIGMLFLKDKLIGNIYNEFKSEIKYGRENNFQCQWKRLQNEEDILSIISNKYDRYMAPNRIVDTILDNDTTTFINMVKADIMHELYDQWIDKTCLGEDILKKIKNIDASKIAIYGAGKVGRWLNGLMKAEDIEASYFIDKQYAKTKIMDIDCYAIGEIPPVDIIVGSIIVWNNDIKSLVEDKGITYISIWDLLN